MAGAIKTEPVTKEYEDGWERTFGPEAHERAVRELREKFERAEASLMHEDSDDLEEAVKGNGDEAPDIEKTHERVARSEPTPYSCPRCGWHLKTSSERCGNATCRMSRRG